MYNCRKKYQVFISSTYKDLRAERWAAIDAILKFGYIPAGMEEFYPAGSESPMEAIKRWIDESDIYMLILGGRYGSLTSNEISFIEEEYKYAMEKNMPGFVLIIDAEELERRKKENKDVIESEDFIDKYYTFRNSLKKQRICKPFKDEKDVKLIVYESLLDIERRYSLGGWVRDANQFSGNMKFRSKYKNQNMEYIIYRLHPLEVGMKLDLTWNTFYTGIKLLKDAMDRTGGSISPDIIFGINESGMMVAGFLSYRPHQKPQMGIIKTGMEIYTQESGKYERVIQYSYPDTTKKNVRCILLVDSEIKSGKSIRQIIKGSEQSEEDKQAKGSKQSERDEKNKGIKGKYPDAKIIYVALVGVLESKNELENKEKRGYFESKDFGWEVSEEYKPDYIAYYIEKPGAEPPGRVR